MLYSPPMFLLLSLLALQDDAEAAISAFKAAYKHPDEKIRVLAVSELGKVQHPKVGKILAGLLTADVSAVRKQAAQALGLYVEKPEVAGAVLISAMRPNMKDSVVLAAIFDACGSLRYRGATDEVNNKLNHVSDDVSVAAIKAAGRIGEPKCMDRLIALWGNIENYRNPPPSLNGGGGPRRTPEQDARVDLQEPLVRESIKAICDQDFKNFAEARDWWNAHRATFRGQ